VSIKSLQRRNQLRVKAGFMGGDSSVQTLSFFLVPLVHGVDAIDPVRDHDIAAAVKLLRVQSLHHFPLPSASVSRYAS